MKILIPFALTTCGLMAQNQATPAATPTPLPETTVVAVTEGKKITIADINKIVESLPPQMRGSYARDPKGFLSQYYLLLRLTDEAQKGKLDQESPFKEAIEMARMNILAQAAIENRTKHSEVTIEEQKKYYEERKDGYAQAKLKLIYIPFAAAGAPAPEGKKNLTEQEALAKAEGVVKQARGGGDFTKLVAEHSEDPISKEQGGDYGPVKREDKLPEAIKQAVFSMKPGDVSDPVRQANGYYIFRLSELIAPSFDEVKSNIFNEMKNNKVRQWLEATSKNVEIKVERQDYFDQLKK